MPEHVRMKLHTPLRERERESEFLKSSSSIRKQKHLPKIAIRPTGDF